MPSFRRPARVLLLAGALMFASFAEAASDQDPAGLWREVSERSVGPGGARRIVPQAYRVVVLDRAALGARLAGAPLEGGDALRNSTLVLSLPQPDGRFGEFRVVESPIMEPRLANKFPEIRTYLGQGIDDPAASVRFDITPAGFHAQVLAPGGTWYVDPYRVGDAETHIAYARRDYSRDVGSRTCQVVDAEGKRIESASYIPASLDGPKISSGSSLRTFRLAVGATGEYSIFHGGTVAGALGAIVSTINRVNGIYERDVAVRMVLVANNDRVIFTNPATDPYTNNSGGTLIGENQGVIDGQIGATNYDIGHVFSTGGGGIASLGSVCSAGGKARGVTGSGSPIGDAYDVDYVAHEMGHQFGAPHTFNSTVGSCGGGNRSAGSAYETGSGVTIMAYAGICGAEDLQPNSEDYFHRASLNSILNFVGSGGGTCNVGSATGNTPPTVSTTASLTIPQLTPFVLSATGNDSDGDALTYLWEQFDLGTATSGGALVDDGARPIFRPADPVASNSRTFPNLRYILANANVPPATAPLPGTTSPSFYTGETLPATGRTLNFRVTVRDNRAGGGGTNEASAAVAVSAAAGPFAVTAPNTALTWAAGSAQPVTWNVANTSAAPVNTANVRILLSTDGGLNFPVVLSNSTANNGSASITVPANVAPTNRARVRVEAIGNVFFDLSDADFTITTAGNTPPTITVSGPLATRQGSPSATGAVATVADTQDAAAALTAVVSGAPPELAVSVVNSGGTINLTATASCSLVAPTSGSKAYPLQLTVTDTQGGSSTAQVVVNVGSNQQPTLGTYANQTVARSTTTPVAPSAAPADPNSNLATPSVSPTVLPGGGTVSINAAGVVSVATAAGTTFGSYPIRASANDSCGAARTSEFTLTVASPDPVLAVTTTAVATGNNLIEPGECNDVNVTLGNSGAVGATAISSVLSSSTPGVTIAQANSVYPNIGSNGSAANSSAFQIGTDPSVPCFSTIALTQTVTYAGGGGSPTTLNFSLPVGRPAATNYAFVSNTGATIPAGGTLVAGSQVDDAVLTFVTPFGFSVYGTPIAAGTTISLSTNGNVQFAAAGSSGYTNTALPVTASDAGEGNFPAAAPTIFAYWDDLNLAGASNGIYTDVSGAAPNRVLKIEWRAVTIPGSNAVDVALLLRENSNVFEVIYNNAAAASGNGATIGVQAAGSGTTLTQFSLNTASVPAGTRLTASLPAAQCTVGPASCGASDVLFGNGFE